MAFHPFRHFRKHQKIYLAATTIFTMVIFVFSFGAADPFQSALRWIGLTSHHGDPVLKLYGKTIYTDDLDKIRWRRQMASEFLLFGSRAPMAKSIDSIRRRAERERKANEGVAGPLSKGVDALNSVFRILQTINDPRFAQFYTPQLIHRQAMDSLRLVQSQFQEAANDEDTLRQLDTIATFLALQAWSMDPNKPPREFYFGGAVTAADLLDFLVWKHEADKLGIVLTTADVCRQVNRAWGNQEFLKPDARFDTQEHVAVFLTQNNKIHKNLSSRDLLSALTDEYRVALAKEAILGSSSGVRAYRNAFDGVHQSPAVATPDEFYRFYREQRTTLAVSMLPIAVERFVAKVDSSPSEQDLRHLYERYKNEEPSVIRRQPGFKEPRRVKVQYFSYRADGPFARKQAAQMLKLLPLFRFSNAYLPFAAGGGAVWAANLAIPNDVDTAVRAEYQNYRREEKSRVVHYDRPDSSQFGVGFDVSQRQVVEALAPSAAVGQLLGFAGAGPLSASTAWMGTQELTQHATLALNVSSVLAAAASSPLSAVTLPTSYLHSVRPLEEVRGQMIERIETNMAGQLMRSHVFAVRKEIDKLALSRSEEKLDAYLKKAIPDNGLENFHAMSTMQTHQEMLDNPDPALKDLRAAYERSVENPFNRFAGFGQQRPDFASAMFHGFEKSPQMREMERQTGIQQPDHSKEFRSGADHATTWVFWRAADRNAHIRPFDDVRSQVKDAWYLERARKLARDEARRINDEIKEKYHDNPADAVKFLRDRKQGEVFELTNVAHLQTKLNLLPGHKFTSKDFNGYRVPTDRIAYPPPDFVTQLLKLQERGDSLVLSDQPVRHFYVAVLMEKPQTPPRAEFYQVYNSRGAENTIWLGMMGDRQRKYVEKTMAQIRSEATADLEEDGAYKLSEKGRSYGESGGGDYGS